MARSFKISFDNGVDNKEVFAIKPNSEDFESLKEELYTRKPELRNKLLKFYYEGEFQVNCNEFLKKDDVIMERFFLYSYVANTITFSHKIHLKI